MTQDAKPTGRPVGSATGQTPMRTLRMGPLWEQGQALAKAHGMTMTALVEEALREKLAKLERQDRRVATDHPCLCNHDKGDHGFDSVLGERAGYCRSCSCAQFNPAA